MKKKRAHVINRTSNGYSTSSSDSFSVEEVRKIKSTKWPPSNKPRQRSKKFSKHLYEKSKRRTVDLGIKSSETSSSSASSSNSSNFTEHGRERHSKSENIQDEGSGQSLSASNTNSSSTTTTTSPHFPHAQYKNQRIKAKGKIKLNQRQKMDEKKGGTSRPHQYHGQEHVYGKRKPVGMVKKSWIFQPCCYSEYNLSAWCVTIAMLEISIPLTIILSNLVQFDNWAFIFGRWNDDYYKHKTVTSNLLYAEQAYFWFFFILMVLCIFCGSVHLIGVYWKSKVFCLAHCVFALILSLKFVGLLLLGILLCNKDHLLAVISTCTLYAISSGFFVYFSLCSLGLFTQFRAGFGSRNGIWKSGAGTPLNHQHSHGDLISNTNTIIPINGEAFDRRILHQDKNFVLSFLKYGIHS